MKQLIASARRHFLQALLVGLPLFAVEAAEPAARSFSLTGAQQVPFSVQFTSDLEGCAVRADGRSVQYWDLTSGSRVGHVTPAPTDLDGKPAPLDFGFIGATRELLVTCGKNLTVHDPKTGRELRPVVGAPQAVTRLLVSPDGQRAVGNLGELPVNGQAFWNLGNGQIQSHLGTGRPTPGTTYGIAGLNRYGLGGDRVAVLRPAAAAAFAPAGSRFFSILERSDVEAWDLDSGRCLGTWRAGGHSGWVQAAVALDDHRVAVVVHQLELRVVDPIAGTIAVWLPGYPIQSPSVLEVRGLALSGDGRRLAVAGMRMKSRPGVMAPAGDTVHDVPQHGEVQIWDVATAKVITTLKGRPTEKFVKVALDQTGQRVAAVNDGVAIQPRWTGAMQQSAAYRPADALRVTVWDLPAEK